MARTIIALSSTIAFSLVALLIGYLSFHAYGPSAGPDDVPWYFVHPALIGGIVGFLVSVLVMRAFMPSEKSERSAS